MSSGDVDLLVDPTEGGLNPLGLVSLNRPPKNDLKCLQILKAPGVVVACSAALEAFEAALKDDY